MCHTVECTFLKFLNCSCQCAFSSISTSNISQRWQLQCFIYSVFFNFTFYVSGISSTPRSVESFLESNLESDRFFSFSSESHPLDEISKY